MITKKLTPKGWEITETTEMEETEHARSNADNSGGNAEPASSINTGSLFVASGGTDGIAPVRDAEPACIINTSSKPAEPGKRSSNGRSRHSR